ncbi:TAX-2 protein [Aphelenchoides avenae]|nr:TAX-2 protein [Aphelenchus avenae]
MYFKSELRRRTIENARREAVTSTLDSDSDSLFSVATRASREESGPTGSRKASDRTSLRTEESSQERRVEVSSQQWKPTETTIIVEETQTPSPLVGNVEEDRDEVHYLTDDYTTDRDDEIQSRLSFIVKEKLHEYARDLRRRTSQVRDEVIREPTPEVSEVGSEGVIPEERQPHRQASLMDLIGLHQTQTTPTDESNKGWIPKAIDPFGTWYTIWLSFVVTGFLYNSFVIPLRSTYPYQTDENVAYWMTADYIFDFFYLLDLVLVKPRLTFMRGGVTVSTPKDMLKHYLMSRIFKLDLFSLLPLDLFYFLTGPVAAWRILRLLKVLSFWEFFDLLDSSFSNPYIIRIAKTFCYMIYIIHCNSCIYYMLSAWQAFGQIAYRYKDQWYLNNWVYNNQGNAYIRCFYFTAAVATSTGNNPAPTNVIEYIYMTFSWMMGVFVFALLLGQIRDIVANANKNTDEFRRTMDKALGECKRMELPEHLTKRVRDWFMYTWEQQKTLDEKKLVEKLPLKLQTDLALSVHYNTLSKVQLFQDADRALLRDLVLKLRPVIFLPGDMICRKGDVGKEMYIVNQGILEVVGGENNELVFATLTEGSVFGEISLLAIGGNNRRTASIRSKGYSTLFVLSKEDLNEVIKDYPDAQQLLKRKARQMLKKDEKKEEKNPEMSKKDLVEKCHVSAEIKTPSLLQVVAKMVPPQSPVAKELHHALDNPPPRRKSMLKRWSTIPAEYSDASDMEMPDIAQLSKAHSLDND